LSDVEAGDEEDEELGEVEDLYGEIDDEEIEGEDEEGGTEEGLSTTLSYKP
jgi:hypothetical protein